MSGTRLIPILIILTIVNSGCPSESDHVTESPSGTSDTKKTPANNWNILKPLSKMEPFVGVWEGEAFATEHQPGKLSGAELREKLRQRSRMTVEARKTEETWYKLTFTVQQKSEPIGDVAPWGVTLSIESHVPEQPVSTEKKTLEIRIRDDKALELRSESLPQPEYLATLKESETEDNHLQFESAQHVFDDVELTFKQ